MVADQLRDTLRATAIVPTGRYKVGDRVVVGDVLYRVVFVATHTGHTDRVWLEA